MAESPSHRFGQIIGEVLEAGVLPLLERFAKQHQLYLDKCGERPVRRGTKVSWFDLQKNKHDLDFVLERGGTPEKVGIPVAFIETAWRRYTKHSKNKAQEIQGAIVPLLETYRNAVPFAGAIIAGEFTSTALAQMRSMGFATVHISYQRVVSVFAEFGIDASSEEDTPDREFAEKVKAYQRLNQAQRTALARALVDSEGQQFKAFMESLTQTSRRQIDRIIVLPLHGTTRELLNVGDAIEFIEGYKDHGDAQPIERFEIQIRYNNGNMIEGRFKDKASAVEFLRSYLPVIPNV